VARVGWVVHGLTEKAVKALPHWPEVVALEPASGSGSDEADRSDDLLDLLSMEPTSVVVSSQTPVRRVEAERRPRSVFVGP
jgi:hypothetical protein